jgi:hypothetical protein
VQRVRDGFEKLPTRGTFTRASKGLVPEWYPMDYSDCEAVRRQGYFHEVIGDIQKNSYRDPVAQKEILANEEAILNTSGSVMLSPTKKGRRGSVGRHVSRQYQSTEGRLEHSMTQPPDSFSSFRKWHLGQLEEDNDNHNDRQQYSPPFVDERFHTSDHGMSVYEDVNSVPQHQTESVINEKPFQQSPEKEANNNYVSQQSSRPTSSLSKLFPTADEYSTFFFDDAEKALARPTVSSSPSRSGFQSNSMDQIGASSAVVPTPSKEVEVVVRNPPSSAGQSRIEEQSLNRSLQDDQIQGDGNMISYLSWLEEQQVNTVSFSFAYN